jgi:hypothetical protein
MSEPTQIQGHLADNATVIDADAPEHPAASSWRERRHQRRKLHRQRRMQIRLINADTRRRGQADQVSGSPLHAAGPPLWLRTIVVAVPVVLVNAVAFSGQLAFLRDHLAWPLIGQVMMAVALETIAVYLTFHAHVAQLANDSALRLRLASYTFGVIIGAMNYSHYAEHWRPTFAAVALGLMSVSSPWLWAVHSRRSSRDALLAQGLVEHHALRLGSTRWTWHPLRSAQVMWLATWEGITDPVAAITATEVAQLPELSLDDETLAGLPPRDRLAVAFGAVGAIDVPKALALLEHHGCAVDQSHSYQIRRSLLAGREA